MKSQRTHIFERSGIAALSDLQHTECQASLAILEHEQADFLGQEHAFRSKDYRWPRDALHTWSRIWEYPYVYYQLQQHRANGGLGNAHIVVDVGSGVTFFPFSVAKLGYNVCCVDVDGVCERDIQLASDAVPHDPGTVGFRLISQDRLPFMDGEVDVVYCISVLEHIPHFEHTIAEVVRILKDRGLFILTIDLDSGACCDIGVDRYYDMRRCLSKYFDLAKPEISTHPLDILVQNPSPALWNRLRFLAAQLKNRLRGDECLRTYPNRAVWGGTMIKRGRERHH